MKKVRDFDKKSLILTIKNKEKLKMILSRSEIHGRLSEIHGRRSEIHGRLSEIHGRRSYDRHFPICLLRKTVRP